MHSKAFFSTLFSAYSIISGKQCFCALEIFWLEIFVYLVHAGICENKHIIESKPLTMPSGNVITMEIFNCSNTVAVPFQQQPSESSATDRRHFLDLSSSSPRDASRRTASNSVCGIPCKWYQLLINFICFEITLPPSHIVYDVGFFTGCFPTNGASTLEDCPDLALSLMQRSEFIYMSSPPRFFLYIIYVSWHVHNPSQPNLRLHEC